MKKIIGIIVGIVMVLVVVYHSVTSSGVLHAINTSTSESGAKTESNTVTARTDLTQFEMNVMAWTGVGGIQYEKEAAKSWGYSFVVQSYELVEGPCEIPEIEGSMEQLREEYGNDGNRITLILNVEVTNENAEALPGRELAQLNLGNNRVSLFNEQGMEIESHELSVCTNNRNNPRSKSAWVYPLGKSETYKGKLVYVLNRESISNAKIALSVNPLGAMGANREKKMIILN